MVVMPFKVFSKRGISVAMLSGVILKFPSLLYSPERSMAGLPNVPCRASLRPLSILNAKCIFAILQPIMWSVKRHYRITPEPFKLVAYPAALCEIRAARSSLSVASAVSELIVIGLNRIYRQARKASGPGKSLGFDA